MIEMETSVYDETLRNAVSVVRTDDGFKWQVDGEPDADDCSVLVIEGEGFEYSDVLAEVDRQARELDEPAWQAACDAGRAPDELVSADGWRYISVE